MRFVVIDDSRSMLKRDAHRIAFDRHGVPTYQECTRWDEVAASARVMASLADAAGLPMELRLLNRTEPVVVGVNPSRGVVSGSGGNGGGSTKNLARILALLSAEPSGTTPMCRKLYDIIDQLRGMEHELRASGKIALLIIMTDCESTDGR